MCFSMDLIKQLLILAVIIIVVFGILKLIVPYILTKAGVAVGEGMNVVISAFKLAFWGFIAIVAIILCFELIACAISWSGGLSLPRR